MESEEKLFTLCLLLLIWLYVSAQHPCAPDEMLEGGECRPCPVCQDGQQLSTVCGYGAGAGAECVSCPPDHYSNTDSNRRCTPCTNCTALNAEYKQLCSSETAAVCGACLPGHVEVFQHCHSCTVIHVPDDPYCRQWLADQMAQKTTPQPGSEDDDQNKSVVIPVVASVSVAVVVLGAGVGAVVFVAKRWKCSSCKSTKRKTGAPASSEEHTLLPMVRPTQQVIADQPTPYTDDPSLTCNSASGHIASVSHDNECNNLLANQTIANGNIAPGHVANGNLPSAHMANGNIPSAHVANGNIPSAHVANGNLPSAHMTNGNIPSAHVANGNIPSAHMANGNIPSAQLANGAVAQNSPISTHPGQTQIGDTLPKSEALAEVAEMVETENLQGAEPYTSPPPLTRALQHSEASAAPNSSTLTSVSSSPVVTATPGNSQYSSSPAPADHSVPAFPTTSTQVAAGNDPMSSALPYRIQNYHSAETLPNRDQEMPGRPPYHGEPFLQPSAQNVTSWSLLQGDTSSSAPSDDTMHPSSSLTGTVSNSSDMEDLYRGLSSATDFSSIGTQDISPKSLLREQSTGPLPEADGAPSTDSVQSQEAEPWRNERCIPEGDSFISSVRDHSDGRRELSIDQSSEVSGAGTDPRRTQREDGRNRESGEPVVELPELQGRNRQMIIKETKELMDKASKLQTGVKVADLDADIKENLALLLDPEPDSPGVHKTWRHFARQFQIEEKLIRNWRGLSDVLNSLETTLCTVPEVLEALFKIDRLDALEELCKAIIDQSEGNACSGQ